MVYLTKKQESDAIRKLFKTDPSLAKYKLKQNKHGRGTAANWIEVITVYPDGLFNDNDLEWEESRRIQWLIQVAVGRGHLKDDIMTDYFEVNILTWFMSASEYDKRYNWRKQL